MKAIYFLLLSALATGLYAQPENYFQQEVAYRINVILHDTSHTLTGDIEIDYTNNAPVALDSIYFHFWGNAFKQQGTAFDEQKLRLGSTKFYFSKPEDRGFYSDLDFTVDGQQAHLVFDKKHPDIGILILPKPLNTGETIAIKTPFTLKIPASFSRLGHVGTSYQMTQWYPKPAVYDHKGWHPMPYLDLGEFYSEFGSFDVTITLPENYVVGATGVLQTESEKQFLQKKIDETELLVKNGFSESDTFPASAKTLKTIRYTAENVHDFAWFADKRFHVLKETATLSSGKQVDAWAMFTNKEADLWMRGAEYVKRAVEFYSRHLGEYPWPQATAVHSALSAGGGMEYPMITVIGNAGSARALDDVITHEVGHNWFYGILATNERNHAWMDEGMNTYYEYRYMRQYYGARVDMNIPEFLSNSTPMDVYEAAYLFQARRNLDQAPETHSNHFTTSNYGLGAYLKPGTAMGHLEQYLGTEQFDAIMQLYYDRWKFKHPYPEDFRQLMEKDSSKDLSWFFDGYINSAKNLDYALADLSFSPEGIVVTVENKGEIAAPFPMSGLKDDEIVVTTWYEGFTGQQEFIFPQGDYDLLILDAEHITLDVNRKNNNLKTSGVFKKLEPLQFGFFGLMENDRRTTINWTPALGWNKYDGFMPGLLFHNGLVPPKKWEFAIATLYGTRSKDVVGLAGLKYHIYPASERIRKITLGLTSKAFNFDSPDSLQTATGFESTDYQYRRLVPSVRIELRRSPISKAYQVIQLRSILLEEEDAEFSIEGEYLGNRWASSTISELFWEIGNRREINPFSLRLTLEHANFEDPFGSPDKVNQVRANLEWKNTYQFDRKRYFDIRVFLGGFLTNDYEDRGIITPGAYNLTGQGFNDYRYDELYFGRTETSGLLSRQISTREGGMKIALGSPYSEGRSNKFIAALNLQSDLPQDLPGKIPLKPYFDIGFYKDNRPISVNDPGFDTSRQLWWQGGVTLEVFRDIFEIYIPIVNSGDVKDLYDASGRNSFFERITFTFNLYQLSPWDLVDRFEF